MLLQIRPGLARAWRAPGRLQIGLDPRCGVVLDGLTAADEHVLAALETGAYDLGRLHAHCRRWGLRPERVDDLVRALHGAGVLLPPAAPAPVLSRVDGVARNRLLSTARRLAVAYPDTDGWGLLARRLQARVVVQGGDRVGLRTALTLAGAGVGRVEVEDDSPVTAADVGPGAHLEVHLGLARSRAAAERLRPLLALGDPPQEGVADEGAADESTDGDGTDVDDTDGEVTEPAGRPTAVVIVGNGALDPGRYDPWLADDVAHLAVVVREGDAVVGPFVRAGRGCCLRCVELYRADRDPQWPQVAAQVATGWAGRCDPTLAEHVAVVAACEVLTLLDGREDPATSGGTLEIAPGRSVPVLRAWPAHPRCGCLALPAPPSAGPSGALPDHLGAPATDVPSTMGG